MTLIDGFMRIVSYTEFPLLRSFIKKYCAILIDPFYSYRFVSFIDYKGCYPKSEENIFHILHIFG